MINFTHVIEEQWKTSTYGVRLSYPFTAMLSITVQMADFQTTQENYEACRKALIEFMTSIGVTGDDIESSDIQVSFYTSQ